MESSVPHMATVGFLTPEEALDAKWADLFRKAHAEWFRPLLCRMAAGECETLKEIEDAYRDARGTTLPRIEDSRDLRDDHST